MDDKDSLVAVSSQINNSEKEELIIPEEPITKEEFAGKDADLVEILKIFSPGTQMRAALDDMMRARMGALVVVDKEGLSGIMEGGFKVNCQFSSQKLVELSKMDGAIILSRDLKKILYANTLLVPKMGIKTTETGTRHKAAERTSKQIKTITIAVSERKNKITLYWRDKKYVLENSSEILRRATETLQILEKQKEIYNELIPNLSILEITNFVTISDVCNVLQRMEIIKKISDMVRRYLVELGKEGVIVSMRLKELTTNLEKERKMVLMDYFPDKQHDAEEILHNMNFDFLLESSNISRVLFEEIHDKRVYPQGIRILSKTNLLERDIKLLLNKFGTLEKIFMANKESLIGVLKSEGIADSFMKDLKDLKEKIIAGKRV